MKKFLIPMFILFTAYLYSQADPAAPSDYREERRFGIGAQLGYFNPSNADNGSLMGGVVAQAKFTRNIGGEISINYRREKYFDGLISVKSWPVLISALYFPVDNIYGLAGLGIYSTTFDYPDFSIAGVSIGDETKTELGFHFGAGFTIPLQRGFRFLADVRYHFTGYSFKEVQQVQPEQDVNANYLSIMAGVMFEF